MINVTACADALQYGGLVHPDPDIAGLGVIIAFIFSACITLVATLAAYAFGMVDEGLLRPVDRLVLRAPSRAEKHPEIHATLRKGVLALSDQQIVTGIAILGAGFNQLRAGTISTYHFQIVIYLAWMSSSVHLSALTLLRPYLNHHKGVMVWRVVGMMVLLVMLLVALVPTVSNEWGVVTTNVDASTADLAADGPTTTYAVPAICYWGRLWGSGVNPDSILSFVGLFISYVWKMGGLCQPVRAKFVRWFRNPIDRSLEMMLHLSARGYENHGGLVWLWMFRFGLVVFLPLEAALECLGSFSAALWISILGLVYGIMQIVIPRQLLQVVDPQIADAEENLGFGQLMPLILLVQPLGAITEHLWLKDEPEQVLYSAEYDDADPYQSTFGHHQDGRHLIGLPEVPFLQYMASYEPPPWNESATQRMQLKALLYTSKLFHLLVWITQATIAATAVVTFWADYWTIGFTTASNWSFISLGLAGWAGLCPVLIILLAPWSRLGVFYGRDRRRSMATVEEQEDRDKPRESRPQDSRDSTRTASGEKPEATPSRVDLESTISVEVTDVLSSEWRRTSVQHAPKSPTLP